MPALILRPQFPNLWPVQKRPESGAAGPMYFDADRGDVYLKTDWWSATGDTSRMDVVVMEGEQKE